MKLVLMTMAMAAAMYTATVAAALGEGRYAIATGKTLMGDDNIVFVIDTKTGKVKYCWASGVFTTDRFIGCSEWFDGE